MSTSEGASGGWRDPSHLVDKMSSLAMSNFIEPILTRTSQVKSPLTSVYSVAHGDDDELFVSDIKAGMIVALPAHHSADVSKRTPLGSHRVLIDDISPYGVSRCQVPDALAVVHSTEWDDCVKVVSCKNAGLVHASWGRDLREWTPRALVVTRDGHIVVSNIHQQATSRICVHTIEGKQINSFGRASGPGNLTFCQPLHMALDDVTGRLVVSDTQTNSVKVFDQRGHFINEFGSKSSDLHSALDSPLGLCCDRRGNIIVCDSGNGRLAMFSHDGRFISNLLSFDVGKKHSKTRNFPVAVALSDAGNSLSVAINVKSRTQIGFRKLAFYGIEPAL